MSPEPPPLAEPYSPPAPPPEYDKAAASKLADSGRCWFVAGVLLFLSQALYPTDLRASPLFVAMICSIGLGVGAMIIGAGRLVRALLSSLFHRNF